MHGDSAISRARAATPHAPAPLTAARHVALRFTLADILTPRAEGFGVFNGVTNAVMVFRTI